jgi:hypothetical protein
MTEEHRRMKDLSREEQTELLLADFEGKDIAQWNGSEWRQKDHPKLHPLGIYKIKPEPFVEKKYQYATWCVSHWVTMTVARMPSNTHCFITTVKDGKPVSIDLEEW